MKKNPLIGFAVLAVLAGIVTAWRKCYRDAPQPQWITSDQRSNFLYGAVDAEDTPGIPYWIWLALPRMFPEYMPAPGGYAALAAPWEESLEMPVGFAKKSVGYVRVTGNCAMCHTTSSAAGPGEIPAVLIAAPGHTRDIQPLVTFYRQCAQDPRFNASEILTEVASATKLSLLDRALYRYVLIPRTKKALLNPENVIFAPALQVHARKPEERFSGKQMDELQAWLKGQRH
ncbi:MAG TPA: hypothetical protein VNH19_18240 [Candidatus Limnocylindrales bacterium]|nr:hypothetical protein [Candidatus Limnocylindrales bacterium]